MKKAISILSVFVLIVCGNSRDRDVVKIEDFCGIWEFEYIHNPEDLEDDLINYSIELCLGIDETEANTLKGWHCSAVRGGRQIDCVMPHEIPSIIGYLKDDTVYISVESAWEGSCKAKLYMNGTGKQLVWEMTEYSGMQYLPAKEVLNKRDR